MYNWTQISTFREGLIFGATIGLLVAAMTNTYWYRSSHYFHSLMPILVDIAATGLTVGLLVGVVALVLNY
jgi:hypothetical protein